jgi:hypothetical protein
MTRSNHDLMHPSNQALRLTRRKMLVLLGGSAAGASLLAATGDAFAEAEARDRKTVLNAAVAAVLAPSAFVAAQTTDHLAGYHQATQAGFSPINSTLSFGSPTDVAAGWDGSAWAIDTQVPQALRSERLGTAWTRATSPRTWCCRLSKCG